MKKRFLSLLLSLMVCTAVFPTMVFAESDTHGQTDTAPVVIAQAAEATWENGSNYNRVIDTTNRGGNSSFSTKFIPTGMIPNEGHGYGKWDVNPATHCENLTEDTIYTYKFVELKDSATVTLKIVNGQWSNEKDPTLTDQDVVIEVPLVNGKGSLDSSMIPNHIESDKGCIPNGTWNVDFDNLRYNVTEDITCTYTCPRVVTEPITYTVSFDGNGATSGEIPEPVSVVSDEAFCPVKIPATTTLKKEGYEFIGWNTLAGGSGRWPVNNKVTVRYDDSNLVLYAQWKKVEKCTIDFVADNAKDSTIPESITLYPNEEGKFVLTIPETPVPIRDGYRFIGYHLIPIEKPYVMMPKAAPTMYQPGDKVILEDASGYQLVAQWEEFKITLTYDANGGTGAPTSETKSSVGEQADFTISEVIPTREGYAFAGWGTEMENPLEVLAANGTLTLKEDTTLYAQWEKKEEPEPENPNKPGPENPDKPNPEKPDQPNPDKPNPEKPDQPNPDKPNPEKPNQPNPGKPNPEKPDKPDSKKPVEPTKPGVPDKVPQTGDSSNLMLWALLSITSLGSVATVIVLTLNKKKKLSTK